MVSGETLFIVKEVFLMLTLGLEIMRTCSASVDLWGQMLPLADEEELLWGPSLPSW
jgi:hypothetical protein